MKNFKFTTLIALIATLAFSATMTSCGDDDNKTNPETNTGGGSNSSSSSTGFNSRVSGWGIVKFTYSTMYDANEIIETKRFKKTVNGQTVSYDSLFFSSPLWGTGKFDLYTKTGSMTIQRRNPQTMEPMGEAKNYDASVSGSSKEGQYVFSIPALMGGTTITTIIGSIPEAVEISKTYDINTYVDNTNNYFPPKSYASANETMVIAPNPESRYTTVNIQYTSKSTPSWGTYVFTNVEVDSQNDTFIISGEGTAAIKSNHSNTVNNYPATIDATVKDGEITGEIKVPGVMGGITIHINPADFDDVINQ